MFSQATFEDLDLKHVTFAKASMNNLTGKVGFHLREKSSLLIVRIFTENHQGKQRYWIDFNSYELKTEEERHDFSKCMYRVKSVLTNHPALRLKLVTGKASLRWREYFHLVNFEKLPSLLDPAFVETFKEPLLQEFGKQTPMEKLPAEENGQTWNHDTEIGVSGKEGRLLKEKLIEWGLVSPDTKDDKGLVTRLRFLNPAFQEDPRHAKAVVDRLMGWGYSAVSLFASF